MSATTKTIEIVALTTRHDEATHRLIEAVDFGTNHWAACPERDQFRRAK
jgi:hypothetical protein